MGWFNKKQKESKGIGAPSLPELPKLPELPNLKEVSVPKAQLPQLPSFPANSIGEKFSQNNIKEAVTGRREYENEPEIDNFTFEGDSMHINQKPLRKPMTIEVSPRKKAEIPVEFKEAAKKVKNAEPVFIRIDKFEESLKIFSDTRERILDIEKMLRDIKKIKDEEEKELELWEAEIKTMKTQIERVDRDIFSKI